jgi:hypothetical protein
VRNAEDARWELAARLGDTDLADEVAFEAALARHPKKAKDTTLPADEVPPQPVNPNHPVTQLSNADLVALARRQAGAPTIATRVCELEHRRPQRSARTLERVLGALGQAVDVSHIRHLCGLCDPHNLKLVTPQGHADVDFRARLNGSGSRWAPNPARARSIEARRGPPDDTVDDVPSDPLYENLEELDEVPDGLVPAPKEVLPAAADRVPAHFVQDFDEDEDWPRSVNFFFGFAAYHLEPVARLLQASRGNIPAALQDFRAREGHDMTESYNHLAGCLNAAVNSYGMDKSLLIDLVPTITRSTP